MLGSIPVRVSHFLEGSKKAVSMGGVLHVSPAMYDLMRHANQDELEHLLKSIGLVDLGEPEKMRATFAP